MRLSTFSDLSFRVLFYAGAHQDRLVTIDEMYKALEVSRGHLIKVVHRLATAGVLRSVRGRAGGVTLNMSPKDINLASIVRIGETDFDQVDCMRVDGGSCTLIDFCKLPDPLEKAMAAYLKVLAGYTLADVDVSNQLNPDGKAGLRDHQGRQG